MRRRWRRPNPAQLRLFDLDRERVSGVPPARRWTEGELLCFDLETTGVDRFNDVPVSLALVRVHVGVVLERTVRIVDPARPIPAEATAVHGIDDERARREGMALDEAVDLLASTLVAASRRGVPVVGVKLDFDLTIVEALCRRLDMAGLIERGWTGPVLDALVLDRHVDPYRPGRRTLVDLCQVYGVTIGQAHRAECDAEAAAAVLLAMADRHLALAAASAHELHVAQVQYHRDWVASYDLWLRSRGLAGVHPSEAMWPIATVTDARAGAA